MDHGVILGEGDGTVSLLSLGYMCAKGWKIKRYNPGGAKVVLYEMPHEPDRFNPRGGPKTGQSYQRTIFLPSDRGLTDISSGRRSRGYLRPAVPK